MNLDERWEGLSINSVCEYDVIHKTRRKQASGLVRQSENFVTLSPFFASHPFETWILPRQHNSDIRNLNPALAAELADALQNNLRTVSRSLVRYPTACFYLPGPIGYGVVNAIIGRLLMMIITGISNFSQDCQD
jgi:hypothetical protein